MGSNHWLGSASMGSSSSNSVVDQNVKVWNTNNLFVIDASFVRFHFPVYPLNVSSHSPFVDAGCTYG